MNEILDRTPCGFIGLGSQGAPIARQMVEAGFPTTLWARRAESLEPFKTTSARFASSIEELASTARYVGVCVKGEPNVIDICRTLTESMAPGGVIAVHSTASPECCRVVARRAEARDISVLDLPVSGGGVAAAAGRLTVMAGGTESVLTAAMPILHSFASEIIRVGDVGTAQGAKLLNNSLLAANLGLARAALAVGESLGMTPDALATVFAHGTARSFALELLERHPDLESAPFLSDLLEKVTTLNSIVGTGIPGLTELTAAARFTMPKSAQR